MKLAFICSRYNDPDMEQRKKNLREHDALCRWAIRHRYIPVSPFCGVDRECPPEDGDERESALQRSGMLARRVGMLEGAIIVAEWYAATSGMLHDIDQFYWTSVTRVSVRDEKELWEEQYGQRIRRKRIDLEVQ